MRGLSARSGTVWASGTQGTYLRRTDVDWVPGHIPGAETLDLRDIEAFNSTTAYALSIGNGPSSRIFKTTDAGAHWKLQWTNPDAKAFYDCFAFWDERHGIALSDPVDGRFRLLSTEDGGENWTVMENGPAADPHEGSFAASGTCLITQGNRNAWFATGGAGQGRVFRSTDRGQTWTVATTPISAANAASGIFSIAFRDARHGIAVGGDYKNDQLATHNIAVTSDGGKTWIEPTGPHPAGFRSAVAYLPGFKTAIAVGTSGTDRSHDDGRTWTNLDRESANAVAVLHDGTVISVGAKGRVAAKLLTRANPHPARADRFHIGHFRPHLHAP